jgi:hypothetical protein
MFLASLALITTIALTIWLIIVNRCRNKQNEFKPSNEEKRRILHDAVFYEILYAFGISPHNETNYCSWEHVNFSRMGHARALYSFFETSIADRDKRRRKQPDYDDVVSEDFKFGPLKIKRPTEDRKRLNKDLFHLTYARLRHTAETKPWPDTILSFLHKPCVEFIKHLLAHKEQFGKPGDFKQWEQLLEFLNSGRELQISRPFIKVGSKIEVAPDQSVCFGRQLQSGFSELTKPALDTEVPSTT